MLPKTLQAVTQNLADFDHRSAHLQASTSRGLKVKQGTWYCVQISSEDLKYGVKFPLRPPIDAWYLPKIKAVAAFNCETKQFKVEDVLPLSLTKPNPALRELVQFTGINEHTRSAQDLEFWIAVHTDDKGTTREVLVLRAVPRGATTLPPPDPVQLNSVPIAQQPQGGLPPDPNFGPASPRPTSTHRQEPTQQLPPPQPNPTPATLDHPAAAQPVPTALCTAQAPPSIVPIVKTEANDTVSPAQLATVPHLHLPQPSQPPTHAAAQRSTAATGSCSTRSPRQDGTGKVSPRPVQQVRGLTSPPTTHPYTSLPAQPQPVPQRYGAPPARSASAGEASLANATPHPHTAPSGPSMLPQGEAAKRDGAAEVSAGGASTPDLAAAGPGTAPYRSNAKRRADADIVRAADEPAAKARRDYAACSHPQPARSCSTADTAPRPDCAAAAPQPSPVTVPAIRGPGDAPGSGAAHPPEASPKARLSTECLAVPQEAVSETSAPRRAVPGDTEDGAPVAAQLPWCSAASPGGRGEHPGSGVVCQIISGPTGDAAAAADGARATAVDRRGQPDAVHAAAAQRGAPLGPGEPAPTGGGATAAAPAGAVVHSREGVQGGDADAAPPAPRGGLFTIQGPGFAVRPPVATSSSDDSMHGARDAATSAEADRPGGVAEGGAPGVGVPRGSTGRATRRSVGARPTVSVPVDVGMMPSVAAACSHSGAHAMHAATSDAAGGDGPVSPAPPAAPAATHGAQAYARGGERVVCAPSGMPVRRHTLPRGAAAGPGWQTPLLPADVAGCSSTHEEHAAPAGEGEVPPREGVASWTGSVAPDAVLAQHGGAPATCHAYAMPSAQVCASAAGFSMHADPVHVGPPHVAALQKAVGVGPMGGAHACPAGSVGGGPVGNAQDNGTAADEAFLLPLLDVRREGGLRLSPPEIVQFNARVRENLAALRRVHAADCAYLEGLLMSEAARSRAAEAALERLRAGGGAAATDQPRP